MWIPKVEHMIKRIESKDNSTLKKIKQLETKKYRDKYNAFLIEGVNLIEEALKNEAHINSVVINDSFLGNTFYTELMGLLTERNIPVSQIPDTLFNYIAETENPQGIMAIVEKPTYNYEDILKRQGANVLVLDRIQDPGNMGTIIRSADASGMDCVISVKGSVDFYLSKVVRSAAGSMFRVPVFQMSSIEAIILMLKENNKKLITSSPYASIYHYDISLVEDIALIIGNEANGVCETFINHSDYTIKIPMLRETESLNASIAASIIMYEMVRQRLNA